MKAVEFKAKLRNSRIQVPAKLNRVLVKGKNRDRRVILLIEEGDRNDESDFKRLTTEQFLKGYSEADSVYDNY